MAERGIHTADPIPPTPVTGPLTRGPAVPILPGGTPLPEVPAAEYQGDPLKLTLAALRELPALLPWFFAPKSAFPFAIPASNIPVNINPAQTLTLASMIVPHGQFGVIQRFGQNGSDFANLRWTILVRGNPQPPIAGIVFQFGTIPAPTLLPGPGILLWPEDNIDVQVTNFGVGVINNVQATAQGYLWRQDAR